MSEKKAPTRRVLTRPNPEVAAGSQVGRFISWLNSSGRASVEGWDALWSWSVNDQDAFWAAIWSYFEVRSHSHWSKVLSGEGIIGAKWFEGSTLNYAEQILDGRHPGDAPAVLGFSQSRDDVQLSYDELGAAVRRARHGLRELGVSTGDRVVAYLPSIPETVVAYLATLSLGAVWAACAPEYGAHEVIERFGQLEPKVLLRISGYEFGSKAVDRRQAAEQIAAGLPSLTHVVDVPYGQWLAPTVGAQAETLTWQQLLQEHLPEQRLEPLEFVAVPFRHPMCVLFSSGTTGPPKPIVHCHGGLLIEHLKERSLHEDMGPEDRMLWYTTTAWMIWNLLVSGLLLGASIVLYDGNPNHPDTSTLWRLAARTRTTVLGVSPGLVMATRREGFAPGRELDLSAVRQVAAAGSPLPDAGYLWIHEQFGDEVLLNVGSGGTDVCTGIVQGSPMQPVVVGEISGPSLGVAADAFDANGMSVRDELAELVITKPMPSMPIGFWGDHDGSRYRESYFDHYPGIWRHGDWVCFGSAGGCVVAGRSDATLNRAGVRLGTAEFYRVVEAMPEVSDSMVIHVEDPEGGAGLLILFVAPTAAGSLDASLQQKIRQALRDNLSPRHVPDRIIEVRGIPKTRTGKKLEVPIKRIATGADPDQVVAQGVLAEPELLEDFLSFADQLRSETSTSTERP